MVLFTIGIVLVLFSVLNTSVFAEADVISTPEPTVTSSVTISPTPSLFPTIVPTPIGVSVYSDIPDPLVAGEAVTLPVTIENATSNSTYVLKLMIKNGETVVNKTYSTITQDWIAWNASWAKFPTMTLDEHGYGALDIRALVPEVDTACTCTIVIRIRSEDGKNKDFDLGTIMIEPGESLVLGDEDTAEDEETNQFSQDLIVDIKTLPKGTDVQIEGVVTSALNELGKNTIYLEDETGGIKVVFKEAQSTLKHGHRISVRGTTQEAYNEYYVKVDKWQDMSVLGEEVLPDPLRVESGDVGEDVEGRVVFINGKVTATSGNTFFINDGSGDAKVYIKSSTNIQKPKMRVGYYSAITGIVSQYKDDYRIMPRFQHDVIVSTQPINPASLGALSVLPETGVIESKRIWLAAVLIVMGFITRLMVAVVSWLFLKRRCSIP